MNEITHGFHNPLNNGGDCYSINGKITIFNHSYKGNVKTFHNQKHAYQIERQYRRLISPANLNFYK